MSHVFLGFSRSAVTVATVAFGIYAKFMLCFITFIRQYNNEQWHLSTLQYLPFHFTTNMAIWRFDIL